MTKSRRLKWEMRVAARMWAEVQRKEAAITTCICSSENNNKTGLGEA
jgi:hypothetical protein